MFGSLHVASEYMNLPAGGVAKTRNQNTYAQERLDAIKERNIIYFKEREGKQNLQSNRNWSRTEYCVGPIDGGHIVPKGHSTTNTALR